MATRTNDLDVPVEINTLLSEWQQDSDKRDKAKQRALSAGNTLTSDPVAFLTFGQYIRGVCTEHR